MNNLVGIGLAIFALYLLGKGEKGTEGQVIVQGQSVPVEPQLQPKNITPTRTPTPIKQIPAQTFTGGGGGGLSTGSDVNTNPQVTRHSSPCFLGYYNVGERDWILAQFCEDGTVWSL